MTAGFHIFVQNQIAQIMETPIKAFYEAPSAMVYEVNQEGVICASGGEYPQWQNENI